MEIKSILNVFNNLRDDESLLLCLSDERRVNINKSDILKESEKTDLIIKNLKGRFIILSSAHVITAHKSKVTNLKHLWEEK